MVVFIFASQMSYSLSLISDDMRDRESDAWQVKMGCFLVPLTRESFEEVVAFREIPVVVFTMPFQTKSDQIAKLRGTADQMRHHLKVDRMVMSKTIAEIIGYCNHMAPEDPLIFPVKDNPFKDRKSCAIL